MRFQQAKDTLETWSNSAGYCALALLADLARLVVTGWMIVVATSPHACATGRVCLFQARRSLLIAHTGRFARHHRKKRPFQ